MSLNSFAYLHERVRLHLIHRGWSFLNVCNDSLGKWHGRIANLRIEDA